MSISDKYDCVVYHSIVMFMGESVRYISPFVGPLPTMHRAVCGVKLLNTALIFRPQYKYSSYSVTLVFMILDYFLCTCRGIVLQTDGVAVPGRNQTLFCCIF